MTGAQAPPRTKQASISGVGLAIELFESYPEDAKVWRGLLLSAINIDQDEWHWVPRSSLEIRNLRQALPQVPQ